LGDGRGDPGLGAEDRPDPVRRPRLTPGEQLVLVFLAVCYTAIGTYWLIATIR
jgi:hypothetical protein